MCAQDVVDDDAAVSVPNFLRISLSHGLPSTAAPPHQQIESVGDGKLSHVLVRLTLSLALVGKSFFAEADIVNGPLESGSGALGLVRVRMKARST
jgi:hypothetical protein